MQATRFLDMVMAVSREPSVHLSPAGCGSFHRLLAVLCFPKVTLGQGGDIPHHAFHPQGPAGEHQPQALYCPNGPLVLMPKLSTGYPQCDLVTFAQGDIPSVT